MCFHCIDIIDACDSWYTTYYTDTKCKTVYKTTFAEDYAQCKDASSFGVSNLVSVIGKCTFQLHPPVMADSYVVRYSLQALPMCSGLKHFRSVILLLLLFASKTVTTQETAAVQPASSCPTTPTPWTPASATEISRPRCFMEILLPVRFARYNVFCFVLPFCVTTTLCSNHIRTPPYDPSERVRDAVLQQHQLHPQRQSVRPVGLRD
jgi:hypothetical protein